MVKPLPKEILRNIDETFCPQCNRVLDWDAVEDISDRSVTIACWCHTCHEHKILIITRSVA